MRITLRSCVPCLLLLLASPFSPQAPGAKQTPLVLTHVTVIDTTGGPAQPDVTVVIQGDRIAAMGKSGKIRVPPGSRVANGASKFLIPGLWDMNVSWYGSKDYLPLFIANGVTGIRAMWGYAEIHELRKEIEAEQLLGPRMVIASRWFDGGNSTDPGFISVANEAEARQGVINAQQNGADLIEVAGAESLARDAFFALADEARKRGIPFAGHMPVSVSLEEASNAGLRSIDHMPVIYAVDIGILAACSSREVDLLKSWQEALANVLESDQTTSALRAGPNFRARMELTVETYDQQKAKALFAVLREKHTWVCPSLTVERNSVFFDDPSIAMDPRLKYVSSAERSWSNTERDWLAKTWSPEDRAVWRSVYQQHLKIVGALRRAGVEFLAGTETGDPLFTIPGFSLHDELRLLAQTGFTPLESLQAATINPARFLGKEQDFGAVATGKIADLVLLDANPLQNIDNTRKIAAVVYRGQLFPRASLDGMLAKMEALASRKHISDVVEATIKEKGIEAAIRQFRELKSTQPNSYDFGGLLGPLTGLGRRLLRAKKFQDAIQILELNVEESPRSSWAYSWLGEAYMEAGEKELAIKNYKKSLRLDPANQHAAIKLKQLNSQ